MSLDIAKRIRAWTPERLVEEQRKHEAARGYQLDRADVPSIDDGLVWMRGTHDGDQTWYGPGDSDKRRRRTLRYWFWLRYRYDGEWRRRGGMDQ